MATNAELTFSSVVSADQSVTETELYADTPGHFELERVIDGEQGQYSESVEVWLFIPATAWLTGITHGTKVSDGTNSYVVINAETFDDHQEIRMHKAHQ